MVKLHKATSFVTAKFYIYKKRKGALHCAVHLDNIQVSDCLFYIT